MPMTQEEHDAMGDVARYAVLDRMAGDIPEGATKATTAGLLSGYCDEELSEHVPWPDEVDMDDLREYLRDLAGGPPRACYAVRGAAQS